MGWSSSRVDQNDYLTLKADGPTSDEWRKSRMSWFTEVGYTDGYWDNHYLTDGGTYWAHLFTDTAFSAGSWVWVQVGTWTNQYTFANDVSVTSEASFKWYINSVWVESTGG